MKNHFVVKSRERHPDDLDLPDWTAFITDKSAVYERMRSDVDRVLDDAGVRYWITREFRPADRTGWHPDEIRQGLDRTYRVIQNDDRPMPPGTVARVRDLPSVEDARELRVGTTRLPVPRPERVVSPPTVRRGRDLTYLDHARAISRGTPDVTVAVLDTGVDVDHPELRGKVREQIDFVDLDGLDTTGFIGDTTDADAIADDEVGHGSHVAGIVAGRGLRMDEGVAAEAGLLAVRVLATMRTGTRTFGAGVVDNINAGIKWAADHGAAVINMSLGIRHAGGALPHEDVIRYALSRNVTVVAASGNDGTAARYYPGALPGVIAVGAVDDTGSVASFTSYGARITVVAPGVDVHSSYAHGGYAVASGTSQASPFVAGAIALLTSIAREAGRTISTGQITTILRETSDRVDDRYRTDHAGYGIVNVADAVSLLLHSTS